MIDLERVSIFKLSDLNVSEVDCWLGSRLGLLVIVDSDGVVSPTTKGLLQAFGQDCLGMLIEEIDLARDVV